jgi:hypothetical protein
LQFIGFKGEGMLTKTMIRSKTNSNSYSKGLAIYHSDRINDFSVEEAYDLDYITAVVIGSGRNYYDLSVVYDNINDTINEIHCECQAFSNYSGICKHCVAVLFKYMNYAEKRKLISEFNIKQKEDLNKLKTMKGLKNSIGPRKEKSELTTPEIKQLLSNHITKRTLLAVQGSLFGKVRVEPFLTCDADQLKVEFKIGVTHMYILKDIFAFINAMENCENFFYGKKLQFVHTMEAFDKQSRLLVQFIRDWAQRNNDRYINKYYYRHSYSYSYSYAPAKIRAITLLTSDLEELLKNLGKESITANVNNTGEKVWRLTKEKLPREMIIIGQNDGIQVKINYLFGYNCKLENIYFHEGKIYRVEKKEIEQIFDFLKCMASIPKRSVYIQKDDIPMFCRDILPTLEQHFHCKKKNFDEKDYGLLPVSFEIYLDAPQKDFITCRVMAVYGDKKYNIYNKTENELIRDQIKEMEVGNLVSSYCNAFEEKEQLMVAGEDEDVIYELLQHGIPRMQEIAEVYISDAMKRLNVITATKVAVGVSVSGDLLELKITSDDMSKEQLLEILTKYNRKKKFYRLKNGDFVNVEGEEIESLIELKQGLHLSQSQLKQSKIIVPRYRTLYLDAELKERTSLSVTKDKTFKALVRNMKTVVDNDFDIPRSLESILREYQKRGYLWIKTLKTNGFCGILADDMGLGKTLQVISFLLSEYLEAENKDNIRALIICPASLVFNWYNEINRFAPELPVKMVIGTSVVRQGIIQNADTKDILVTSYDLLKRDIEYYETTAFNCEIIDEAQYIKNSNTQAAKAVKLIDAGFKMALTGTPIENRLSELWSVFDYLMPGFLYSYQKFRDELEIPIVQNQEEKAMKRLQKMIAPFILRRLKKEVLTDLPDKLEEIVYVNIEGEQQKLYDAHVKKLQIILGKQSDDTFKNSKIQILSELTKLRQICCDPALLYENYNDGSAKIDICMELIRNAISGGHKILLFSQFTSMLKHIQEKLQKDNIDFYSLTGATSKEKRSRMVESFNKDKIPVFCISLKAGGTGLNLTAADIVIHFDPWWNLAVQNQATDRVHRIGQENVVSVYKLIVKGTIEEKIVKIQNMKKELAEAVLSGKGMSVGSFTREELLELLD